jgi:hypothetical protein
MYERIDDRLQLLFAHNDYLQFAAENGIVAGVCLAAAGIWLVVIVAARWRRRRYNFARGVGLGALLGIVAILIHGLTDFNLQITANAIYFVGLCALALNVTGGARRPSDWGDAALAADMTGVPRAVMATGAGRLTRGSASAAATDAAGASGRGMPIWKFVIGAAATAALLVGAAGDYVGYRYRDLYLAARQKVRSVQSGFGRLEVLLATAQRFSHSPEISREAGRLDMEMVQVENEAGNAEARDLDCDKAVAAYGRTLEAEPIDAFAQFEMGMAYLYYNYPLQTYMDTSKLYFRMALRLKPADEFLNLNILFFYLTWWDGLEPAEKTYVKDRLDAIRASDPEFMPKLEERWTRVFGAGAAARLAAILGSDQIK